MCARRGRRTLHRAAASRGEVAFMVDSPLAGAAFLEPLRVRREQIAQDWHRAIQRTSFTPLQWREARGRLLELTDRLIDLLPAEPFDHRQAEEIGVALVQLHYVHPEALRHTHEVLAQELVAGVPAAQLAALQPRLTALLGGIAAGFAAALRDLTYAEQDVTRTALLQQRRRAEAALRESEARFRAVFATAGIGIGLADLEGRITESNPAWQRMLDYNEEELLGRPFTEVSHPEDAQTSWLRYQELVAGRLGHYAMEARLYRKGGEEVWVHLVVTLVRDAEGRPQFSIGMGEDITERKRAEAALERQHRATESALGQLRAVLDAAGDAMLFVDPDRRVLLANQRVEELLAIAPRAILGRRLDELRPKLARAFPEQAALAALLDEPGAGAQPSARDLVQEWPQPRVLHMSSTPVRGAAGAPIGRLYALRDVTGEREVDRLKSELVSLVSHELRSPLTAISGYVDLLLAGDVGEMDPNQQEFLGIVKKNTGRLVELTTDLLDLAHIESGSIELKRSAVDLARVVADVAAMFRVQIEGKGQRLVLHLPDGLPLVWGDADRLTQIVINLVSNAHKYTPADGAITIAARPEGAMVCLEVRDTGIGLVPEDQARLFTRFFRVRDRVGQAAGGSGLGLAITRSLVELHGGEIAVESAPGTGSTFSVTLPAAETEGVNNWATRAPIR